MAAQPERGARSGWWGRAEPEPPGPVDFATVIAHERAQIATRRERAGGYAPGPDLRADGVGLALSGGGIRSATFSLGVLQGLHALGVLRAVDYLSTVSGGGYVGGWWTAWLSRPDRQAGEHFPREERIETERTPDYGRVRHAEAQEAGTDPVHHLRLFGNYLTPRKGLLSADTWRAVAVVSRNLVLTWLVLLPILVAVLLLGQLYYVAQPFDRDVASAFLSDPSGDVRPAPDQVGRALVDRLAVAARIPLALLLVLAWITALWMHFNNAGSGVTHTLNALAVAIIIAGVAGAVLSGSPAGAPSWLTRWDGVLLALTAVMAIVISVRIFEPRGSRGGGGITAQARGNRATQWHARVLVVLVMSAATLLFAGFAHEVVPVGRAVAGRPDAAWPKAVSAIGTLLAGAATLFTAFKAAPSGGRDARDIARPSRASRIVFALAPVLLLLCLATLAATIAQLALSYVHQRPQRLIPLGVAAAAGLTLCVVFASWENHELKEPARRLSWLYPALVAAVLLAVVPVVVQRWVDPAAVPDLVTPLVDAAGGGWAWSIAVVSLLLSLHLAFVLRRPSPRVRLLLAFVAAVAFGLAALSLPPLSVSRTLPVLVALVVLSVIGGWVVALGWMADPNALALHTFYKARLVRAYLGASNRGRRERRRDITESDGGDDLRMAAVQNCERGGPYPLISTTLNLVGGRDLATAQRSAAHFLISPGYCGSERTGYRATNEYMAGALTLGAAVATSGAAVSPNMGSATPSSALALLLAFLNIRLGLWVPTPDRGNWQDPQTRLWPASLLRESLSQTTDTASHCYLTDGGHFDNTGLYPLAARACRYIVVCDNGADPDMCFEDMGAAIRRCRIDFRAEISLDIDTFRPIYAPQPAGQVRMDGRGRAPAVAHVTFGTIAYHPRHLADLGQASLDPRGRIVWIKPAVLDDDAVIDIRQYALQNATFPQQSTVNQWFGESQFESYRKLGEWSARRTFDRPMPPGPLTRASLEVLFSP